MHGEESTVMAKRRYGARTNYVAGVLLGVVCGLLFANWSRYRLFSCGISPGTCCSSRLGVGAGGTAAAKVPSAKTTLYPSPVETSKRFILVGVMTADKYLNTRAVAAYRTWVRSVNGKVIFFSSEGSRSKDDIPVIGLSGVDDSYPPQRKSFTMLKYMHDNYIDQFEWFMRADDDVYIKGDRLERFLHSINSSKALFIGQAGLGTKEELGQLSLDVNENFCMGGPGVVVSRATLQLVASHVDFCLQNLYTTHEDVEVGRCIKKFAGVSCTWAFEMQQLFFHNYKEEKGSFTYSLNRRDMRKAITLHPVKDPVHQYRIHNYLKGQHILDLAQKMLYIQRDLTAVDQALGLKRSGKVTNRLGLRPSLMKHIPETEDDVFNWEFFTRPVFSAVNPNPKHSMEGPQQVSLNDIVEQVMAMVNGNAYQRGRTIDFKEILYGYRKNNRFYSNDYILDLLLIYKKHKGRRMTVPVRRHAYLQQNFGELSFLEDFFPSYLTNSKVSHPFQHLFFKPNSRGKTLDKTQEVVQVILPLAGRFEIFRRFMKNFEEILLKVSVQLHVVVFDSPDDTALQKTLNLITQFQQKHRPDILNVIQVNGLFSRAKALELGAAQCKPDSLLFFVDVDIVMSVDAFHRIRLNTRQGIQVYFPIVFSQYNPVTFCKPSNKTCKTDFNNFDANYGYWRQFGFGIASMYQSDLRAVGGFDISIQGWGKEDVDLYEKFLSNNITIFRSVDPGLFHAFHPVTCDLALEAAQYQMCTGSKASSYASIQKLAQLVYGNPELLNQQDSS